MSPLASKPGCLILPRFFSPRLVSNFFLSPLFSHPLCQHLPPQCPPLSLTLSLSSTHAVVCLSLSSLRLPSPLPTPPPPWLQAMFRRVLGQPLNRNSDGTSLHRWSAASADVAFRFLIYSTHRACQSHLSRNLSTHLQLLLQPQLLLPAPLPLSRRTPYNPGTSKLR